MSITKTNQLRNGTNCFCGEYESTCLERRSFENAVGSVRCVCVYVYLYVFVCCYDITTDRRFLRQFPQYQIRMQWYKFLGIHEKLIVVPNEIFLVSLGRTAGSAVEGEGALSGRTVRCVGACLCVRRCSQMHAFRSRPASSAKMRHTKSTEFLFRE